MNINKLNIKLVPNLNNKKKYVIHIRALDQALKHGLVLEKFHRIVKLNQRVWLKTYINKNTELRKDAKNDAEKDFFKLMNSNAFNRTISKNKYLKYVMKLQFKDGVRFTENVKAVEMGQDQNHY